MPQAQRPFSQIVIQMQTDPKALPANVKGKQIYFESFDPGSSRGSEESKVMRGASRQPTAPLRGNYECQPSINTELQATDALLYAACGSMESSMAGGTLAADLAVTAGVINSVAQTLTLSKIAHGLVVGDSAEIAALTAPTSLNDKIWPVIAVPTANTFTVRIPMGTTSTFTKGPGTVKKVTAAGVLTHTIKAGGTLPDYVLEFGATDIGQYQQELGCKLASLGFSIGAKGAIALSTRWLGIKELQATAPFDAAPLDNGKRSFDNMGIAAADMKEGGVACAQILSIDNISLDNAVTGDTFVVGGGGFRSGTNADVYKITGTVKAIFEDAALYTKAINSTETSLDFKVKRGSGDGTDGNETIQVVISEIQYSPKSPTIPAGGGIVELPFVGYYDNSADGTALKVVVVNSVLPGAMI